MPPGFHFPDDVDVWQRLQWDLTQHSRSAHFMEAVARLRRRRRDRAGARRGGRRSRRGSAEQFDGSNKGWAFGVVPLLDDQLGYYRPALYVLFGAVGLLFVIGCLNVASLLLTRALGARARDRRAHGARRRAAADRHAAAGRELPAVRRPAPSLGLLVALVALPADRRA